MISLFTVEDFKLFKKKAFNQRNMEGSDLKGRESNQQDNTLLFSFSNNNCLIWIVNGASLYQH